MLITVKIKSQQFQPTLMQANHGVDPIDNVIYTDWKRDNFLRAIVSIIGRDEPYWN